MSYTELYRKLIKDGSCDFATTNDFYVGLSFDTLLITYQELMITNDISVYGSNYQKFIKYLYNTNEMQMWLFKAKELYISGKLDLLSCLYWFRAQRKSSKTFFTIPREIKDFGNIYNQFETLQTSIQSNPIPISGGDNTSTIDDFDLNKEDDELDQIIKDQVESVNVDNTTVADISSSHEDNIVEDNRSNPVEDTTVENPVEDNSMIGGAKFKSILDFELDDLLEPVEPKEDTKDFDLLFQRYSFDQQLKPKKKLKEFKFIGGNGNGPNRSLDASVFKDAFKTFYFILTDEEPGFQYFGLIESSKK
jgi:hypothetical protein